jgi:flagellar biogenesis protein FliO
MANALKSGLSRLAALPWPRAWRPAERRLRVAETLSLGTRGFVALIECGSEQLLIGGTAHSLALLTKLPSKSNTLGSSHDCDAEENGGRS